MAETLRLTEEQEQRAERVHREAIVVDGLGGRIYPESPTKQGKEYIVRLIEAGVTATNVTLAARVDSFEAMLNAMYGYYNLFEWRPDKVVHIETVDDILQAKADNRTGVIFGAQTGTPIGRHVERWAILHKLGLRICQLTYNERNVFGDGCYEPENRGLTASGTQAVNECNRLGIVLDCSHAGERTSLDIMEQSSRPVVFSHSNAKKLTPHSKRCITDEQIKKCAATGGVIGISPHTFLSSHEAGKKPEFDRFVEHFVYVANLVGVDHVAIGSDVYEAYTEISWSTVTKRLYPGPWTFQTMYPDEFRETSQFPNVTRALVKKGFSDEEIKKILGENWLRVFRATWK